MTTALPRQTRPRPGLPAAADEAPRVDSLTGMRFLAALAVFVHHFTGLSAHGGVAHAPLLFPYSTLGANGVGFFFVLSGFLLTWGYRPGTLARLFYWRRAGRILPAHLVATIPVIWVFYLWGGVPTDDFSFVASLFLVQTWFPGVVPTLPGNGVAWTLSVEAFFYLLFPFAIRGALRLRTRTLALLAGGGLVAMWLVKWWTVVHLSPFASEWVMRNPVSRLPEFGVGMACALALRRGHRFRLSPPVLLVCLAGYAVVYCHRASWFGPDLSAHLAWTLRPCAAVFSVLFVAACVQRELTGHRGWLCSRPMVLLGLWSYAFYLLHQTVNRLILDTWGRPQPDNSAIFTLLGVALTVVALSWAMFTYIEEPARKWCARRTPRRWSHCVDKS
ncbi:acyltransferase [Streptomyces longisporoflavus]|uniref:acyltransferase family protein n=1 Tax=Streptomyces longisporoflavus TaxID=28044 RepID=UPI00167EC8D3|nr:acyltransferase [Streptomyces longisporoflavus]GGV30839.1 acyltransferase [Streptomyces longisporoflavus]